MGEFLAIQVIGAKRDKFVKAHGNAKRQHRPYSRIPAAVRREAEESAALERNVQRLVEQVRGRMGVPAATFDTAAADNIIRKVRTESGDTASRGNRHNMAKQMMDVQTRYLNDLDTPGNRYLIDIQYSTWVTQASTMLMRTIATSLGDEPSLQVQFMVRAAEQLEWLYNMCKAGGHRPILYVDAVSDVAGKTV